MSKEAVFAAKIADQEDLAEFIRNADAGVRAAIPGRPVMYVTDVAGNPFTKATLVEETLTDGSKVYNILLF